jgi:hypothetical protein
VFKKKEQDTPSDIYNIAFLLFFPLFITNFKMIVVEMELIQKERREKKMKKGKGQIISMKKE